jgi:transposase-like protein
VQELVRASVEETLNAMLDAEADAQCGAKRYERSPEWLDTRAGHYERKLLTPAGGMSFCRSRRTQSPKSQNRSPRMSSAAQPGRAVNRSKNW